MSLDGSKIRVEDASGRPIPNAALQPGDDPVAVARRILKEQKPRRDFYAPIQYRQQKLT
jgi:hypothetical protein